MRPSRRAESRPAFVLSRSMPFQIQRMPRPSASSFFPPAWSCRSLGEAAESRPGIAEPLHDSKHVAEGARQSIEFPYHEHDPFAELIDEQGEFRPTPPS